MAFVVRLEDHFRILRNSDGVPFYPHSGTQLHIRRARTSRLFHDPYVKVIAQEVDEIVQVPL